MYSPLFMKAIHQIKFKLIFDMLQSLNHEHQLSNAELIRVLSVLFRHQTVYPTLI